MRPLLFLFGYKRWRIDTRDCEKFLEMCGTYGIVYRDFYRGDESCEFICSYYTGRKMTYLCDVLGIKTGVLSTHGIPEMIARYKKRYGILLGLIAFCAIIFGSTRILWDVRIDGERRLSEDQVIAILEENGLFVGATLKKIDTDVIENRTLISSDDISWISVNIRGTVANVEIRETEFPEEKEDETKDWSAGNLVAIRSGTILYFEDLRGNLAVEIGETVSEGQLLVGGVYDSETVGNRYTVARGRVIAETKREFRVEIPLTYEQKVPTERKWKEKYLNFFKKEVKFFTNYRNSYASCDTIDIVEKYVPLNFFDLGDLPIGVRTREYVEYTVEVTSRDLTVADGLARYQLGQVIDEELGDGEILSKSYESYEKDGKYVLICRATCIEDIGRAVELEIVHP